MAHNGQHREAALRDELKGFHKTFYLEKLSFRVDSNLPYTRRKVDRILQLKICIIIAAAMACGCSSQSSSSFSFDSDNFVPSNLTILQDASITAGQINLNSNGAYKDTDSRGRALYRIPVQFLEPATNSVASFQTSFTFTIYDDRAAKGHGFAFGLFPDATSVGDSGKFLGVLPLLNTTSNNSITANDSNKVPPGFDHTFVVEFDTHKDIEFGDLSDNHVGVNWNSMGSLNATDLTGFGLDLLTGNFTVQIEYSYPSKTLSVWMGSSQNVLNTTADWPVLEVRDLDLSQLLLPTMYVGFAGGVGVGNNEVHTIQSWTFNSSFYSYEDAPVPSPESSEGCGGECKSRRFRISVMVCLPVLSVCLVSVTAFCCFRWRRRKAVEASMILKKIPSFQPVGPPLEDLGPTVQDHDPPLQERKPVPRRSSLVSKLLDSAREASPSRNKPFSPRGSLSSNPFNSPRASLGSNPFSPRASLNPFTPLRRLSSMDNMRSKHSRTGSATGSKRFTTTQELDAVSSLGPRRYTYRELKLATNSFKETLGKGGFGTVYKGFLPNYNEEGIPVAVKEVAADSDQGEREFLAEINIIAGLRHRHLVQMQGWCHEKGKLLLIYDFMENGSLDKYLYKTNPGDPVLSWDVRYKALCQVASALTYLHDEAEQKVIHRDVKASNVLLDSKFNARLGDFGLARLSEHSQVADTTVMAGTLGYLAPEIVQTGKATTKTDVFSFGTLILEVMCAKRPLDCNRPQTETLLGDWVWGLLEARRLLDAVDHRLVGLYDTTKMTRALQLGLMCIHPDHTCRPPIRYALQMLLGDLALPTLPTHKPASSFSSVIVIPMDDLLQSSMSTIAAAMECPQPTKATGKSAEFEAPWMLKISSPFSSPLTNSVRLSPPEPVAR
ncbi:unnamed protein product [Calypogeia fissa]